MMYRGSPSLNHGIQIHLLKFSQFGAVKMTVQNSVYELFMRYKMSIFIIYIYLYLQQQFLLVFHLMIGILQ